MADPDREEVEDVEADVDAKRKSRRDARPVRKLRVRKTDMPDSLLEFAVEAAQCALDDTRVLKDVAISVKKAFDDKHGGTWHAFVGTHFGCNVTHEYGSLASFSLDRVSFTIFRSGPPIKTETS